MTVEYNKGTACPILLRSTESAVALTMDSAKKLQADLAKVIEQAEKEPEMTEFENGMLRYLQDAANKKDDSEIVESTKEHSPKLLALAKKQLLQSGELLTQEHHEKLMETQYKETLDGVKKNWHDYFTPQAVTDIYNAGRNDVLKDLPRWKKASGKERFSERMIVLAGDNDLFCTNYAEEGEYYLPFPILEKLPKEEDHE